MTPLTMTEEREFVLRSETAHPAHGECPDHWADCNWAREASVEFAAEVDALREKLAAAERERDEARVMRGVNMTQTMMARKALAASQAEAAALREAGDWVVRAKAQAGFGESHAISALKAALSLAPSAALAERDARVRVDERERCAKVAHDMAHEYEGDGSCPEFNYAADVEKAIRSQPDAGQPEGEA